MQGRKARHLQDEHSQLPGALLGAFAAFTACTYSVKVLDWGLILDFADQATEDLFHGVNSRHARRIPQDVWQAAIRKLDMLNAAADLRDLRVPPSNRLESLKGKLAGCHSIRINDQYRIVFEWRDGNAAKVGITDYH